MCLCYSLTWRLCRQLTILEERLEKAEALLRSHFSQEQLQEMMDGTVSTTATTAAAAPTPATATGVTPASTTIQSPHGFTSTLPSGQEPLPSIPVAPAQARNPNVLGIAPPTTADSYEQGGGSLVAPSVVDDFEWDETDSSWSAYGTGAEGSGSGGDTSTQAIMDGMASLSVGARRGYLGAVSGAALLRQILSARKDGDSPADPSSNGISTAPAEQFESLFQQEPDQQSHWYRAQSMLTRVAVENLIDAFFTLYHPTFPIVHEPTFRAQYAGTLPRADKERWNTLANIMAALGSFAGSNCADATDLPIFQAAQRSLFAANLEAGNLTTVQAFGLSATYLQKRNKPNTGYNYGGIALRMAIGLGLHKEFEEGYISPLQMEIRRRVWWTLCILDVGATITYGRPLNWPQAGIEAALPKNIHEEVSFPGSETVLIDELTRSRTSYWIHHHIRRRSMASLDTPTSEFSLPTTPAPCAYITVSSRPLFQMPLNSSLLMTRISALGMHRFRTITTPCRHQDPSSPSALA